MRISVAGIFFNNGTTAGPCMESLLALRWPDKEVIAVYDTASRDNTLEVLRKYRDRIHKFVEVHGVVNALAYNAAAEAATGDLVLIADGDTLYAEDYLERIAPCVGDDPWVAGALGRKRIHEPRTWYQRLADLDYSVRMRKGRYSPFACHVFRRKTLLDIGGYWPKCGPTGWPDYDLGVRLRKRGFRIAFCEEARWFEIERANLRQEFWRHFRRGASVARTEPSPEARWAFRYGAARAFYPGAVPLALLLSLAIPAPWRWFWIAAAFAPLAHLVGRYLSWGLRDGTPQAVLWPLLGFLYRDPAFALGYLRGLLGPLGIARPGRT
ncbi:MAG: glycosyltransferase family 2 protein [Halobacteria archaeon]